MGSERAGLLGLRQRPAGTTGSQGNLEDGGVDRHRSMGMGEMARFFKDLGAAPDRGKSFYQAERQRQHLASLVEAGRHAGRSRVQYEGRNIKYHLFTKDFFISVIDQKTTTILLVIAFVYLFIFFFFSLWWWLIIRYYPGCMYGATTYVEAFTFAVITHMTIGYGNTGPQNCWVAAWLIVVQIISALLLESIVIGIVFARISHPKQRSRSIFISDSAVVARRDGILKFMFRVADIRRTQVVDPKIKAFMYTWGEGRMTAEGERIPVRCEPLDIGYIDGMLLLPLIIEHTIDERSPLCGHTHDSLMALNAEIVVTFEGTTEFGNPFMARRSYLPTEIHWGHQFSQIVLKPEGEEDDPRYVIDLNHFHDVVPQEGLPLLAPSQLSQLVVNRAKRTVPYPLLGENTLVLSDVLCVSPNEDGQPCLFCRAADTYPNQMLEITVRMYLYRWSQGTGSPSFTQHQLDCGYEEGTDRLYLRLPTEVCHPITERSPLARWLEPGGLMEDADSEIVVVINSYLHVNGQNRLRQRTYTVHNHVRYGFRFQNIVKHPAESRDRKPRVRWAHFHDIAPVPEEELGQLPGRDHVGLQPAPSHPNLPAAVCEKLPSTAPESHGALRAQQMRQQMWSQNTTQAAEYENGPAGTGVFEAARRASVAQQTIAPISGGGGGGSPPGIMRPPSGRLGRPPSSGRDLGTTAAAAAAAAAAGGDTGGGPAYVATPAYVPTAEEQRNDYTVLPIDLSRYAATAGNEGDSIPLGAAAAGKGSGHAPLPTAFAQLVAAQRHQEEVQQGRAEPFLLFPEVASYALGTTDAGDSLPHAQALHPTLPGPDRFRVDVNEQNDYTVLPMDLSRYGAQVARSDTFDNRARQGRPITYGEAAVLLAQAQQGQQQQQQQQQQAGVSGPRAESSSYGGDSGYATPASGQAASPPFTALMAPAPAQQGSPAATPKLGGAGYSAGAAAAAAALGAAVPKAERQQQGQQLLEGEEEEEEEDNGTDATSSIGSDSAAAEEEAAGGGAVEEEDEEGRQQQGDDEEEGRQLAPAQLSAQLQRTLSSWRISEEEKMEQEEGSSVGTGAGPIHFTKQESWQRDRALNPALFASPDSPTAGSGDQGGGAGEDGQPAASSSSSQPPEGGSPAGGDKP